MPPLLHFSSASTPVRTGVACPLQPPEWYLDCPARANRIVAWLKWSAWSGTVRHQFSLRVYQKPRARGRRRRRGKLNRRRSGTKDGLGTESEASSTDEGAMSEPSGRRSSEMARRRVADSATPLGTPLGTTIDAEEKSTALEPVTGWIELPPCSDNLRITDATPEADGLEATVVPETRPSEEEMLSQYLLRLPPREWNGLLFRHYVNQDEFFDAAQLRGASRAEGTPSVSSRGTRRSAMSGTSSRRGLETGSRIGSSASGAGRRARSTGPVLGSSWDEANPSPSGSARGSAPPSAGSSRMGRGSSRRSRRADANQPFRMRYGMQVEWRVRSSDGVLWSSWSPASIPAGIVPPMPQFTTHLQLDFSQREPTIARLAWGQCTLPPEYEHLMPTIEYVVYLTTDDNTAKEVFQVGQGTFSKERLYRKGMKLSEGTCGIVLQYREEEEDEAEAAAAIASGLRSKTRGPTPTYDPEGLFSGGSEVRIAGKFTQADAKWVNLVADCDAKAVTGFTLIVSGLKPESLHRLSVRARCATTGLDDPDWQKKNIDSAHVLRWNDPLQAPPVLTPKMPPPMLVPEPITIPDGRFARFIHTPCVLLKCAQFQKAHPDDFDKEHPVVVDVRPRGTGDEDYTQVPLENSVYCEIKPHGPCRLLYNVEHLHAELRIRNTIMNYLSANCPPLFTVPPLPLETKHGPSAELLCSDDGHLFIQITWTTRCLPLQEPWLTQLSLKRHSVEAPAVDLQAFNVTPDMVLEEFPANTVLAAGATYERFARRTEAAARAQAAASADGPPRPPEEGETCPFACRRCFRPLDLAAPAQESLGPFGAATLDDVGRALENGTVSMHEVPKFRGVEDDLDSLRAPHQSEVEAKARAAGTLAPKQPQGRKKPPRTCNCRDVILRKTIPVDGDQICYGTTYRVRLRVKDKLTWSQWTEFSVPLLASVPPPKPVLPQQKDVHNPVPLPSVDVLLIAWPHGTPAQLLESRPEVTLRVHWGLFSGLMQEVEYRVFMWTLSPEQRRKAANRQPFDLKGPWSLPPIVGTQTFVLNPDAPAPVEIGDDGTPFFVTAQPGVQTEAAPVSVKPRAQHDGQAASNGSSAVQHSEDGPQIVANLQPFHAAPRANAQRRAARNPPQGGGPGSQSGVVSADVSVVALPSGHGYVFGVEAKHSRGTCGNVGEWSTPLFSKLIEFEHAPRQLNVAVDARFGALLFKGNAVVQAKPSEEQVVLEMPAVSHADEHRDLPAQMGLLPANDPWPLHNTPGKMLVRTKGKSAYVDRLEPGDVGHITADHLPDSRPHKDDFRAG